MPLHQLLNAYQPFDTIESENLNRLRELLLSESLSCGREVVGAESIRGHITVVAWIVDTNRRQTLLTYHAKTATWLPPGEHCDDDTDIAETALQIAQQITGLQLAPLGAGIFDINIRIVPEYWNTPEHQHYELCFAMQADAAVPPIAPTRKMLWVALEEVQTLNDEAGLARLVAKTRLLLTS